MIYSHLPFCNRPISRIGLGTVQFGLDYGYSRKKSQTEVDEILRSCVKNEINFLDTARGYGDSEEKIGTFIAGISSSPFFIATKLEKIPERITSRPRDLVQHIEKSINSSLEKLRVPRIDLLQLHQTDTFVSESAEFWEAIGKLKGKGYFEFFGISTYEVDETVSLINRYGDHLNFVQVPFSVFDQRFAALGEKVKGKRIGLISRSALLKGLVAVKDEGVPVELQGIKEFKERLERLADRVSLSVSEVAILFAARSDFIDCTLVGMNSVSELEANVRALEHISQLDAIEEDLRNLAIDDPFLVDPRRWTQL